MKNRYYLIEPIDIDGDKNPDGFLVSQYRIDKNGNKIFLKNKYITYKLFKEKVKSKSKTGGRRFVNSIVPVSQNKIVYVNEKGYNANMNTKYYPNYNQPYRSNSQPYPYNPHQNQYQYNPYQNQYNPNNPYNQYPPQVMVRDNNSFGSNLMSGLGLGIGFSFADNIIDGFFN
jgi:hypothetical protein